MATRPGRPSGHHGHGLNDLLEVVDREPLAGELVVVELLVLADLLRMQEEPFILLAAIGKELRRIYTARMALDAGKDRFWLKSLWNMRSDYPAKLLMQAAGRVDHAWCSAAVKKARVCCNPRR